VQGWLTWRMPTDFGQGRIAGRNRPVSGGAHAEPKPHLIFHEERLRHLVAEAGVGQIVYGTDDPFDWPVGIDFVLKAPFLSDADKTAILGSNASRLLRIGA
jgi:predicted TIM-barrel fold metal-dependent hydrolase